MDIFHTKMACDFSSGQSKKVKIPLELKKKEKQKERKTKTNQRNFHYIL